MGNHNTSNRENVGMPVVVVRINSGHDTKKENENKLCSDASNEHFLPAKVLNNIDRRKYGDKLQRTADSLKSQSLVACLPTERFINQHGIHSKNRNSTKLRSVSV